MGFPIHIDTVSMGLPIVFFKGSQEDLCISVAEGCLNLANGADPDGMQQCCISSGSSLFA